MKKVKCSLPVSKFYLASVAILLHCSSSGVATAADKTWDGEGANNFWQTAANWDPIGGGTAPVANDSLIFDGFTRLTPQNDFPAGTIFENITFNGSADAFTLGGNALTLPAPPSANYLGGLNAPYLGGSISNLSFNVETINFPLTLADGHHYIFGNLGGGSLNLAAPVTLGSAASVSFTPGVNLNGAGLATVNGILGGWATMSPPTGWATLDGGDNVVEYTAYTDISAGGAIVSSAASNMRILDSGANVTLAAAGTTDLNTLHFGTAPIGNQTVDVAAGRILRFGDKGGIFNASRQITGTSRVLTIGTGANVGSVTAGGTDNTPGDLYLVETPFIGNTGNQLVMNSVITDNGTGPVTVHTFGHVSYPNVNNAYSGGTHIHGGRVQTRPDRLGSGPVYVYPGGQLFFNANATCPNDIFIAGYGNAEANGNGAIRMGGTGRIITGTITLTADAATANGTFNGPITGPGRFIVGAGTANGAGTTILGATNDYSGDTQINGDNTDDPSTLQMTAGRPHVMPHGAGKGNLILRGHSATVAATFNLNGTDQTINGLNSIGVEANTFITSGTAGAATLILGDGNANGNFGGVITNGIGAVGVVKIGNGTQILRGANSYTNGTTVNGGALVFGAANSFPTDGSPTVTVNNATLNLAAATPVTLGNSSVLAMSDGTVVVDLPPTGSAINVPTLNPGGSTNYVSVTSIPAIASYPAQFVAIKYTTLNGTLNFGLGGSLPPSPGAPFAGYVSNNVANGSVDLVITAGPSTINWVGYSSGAPNSTWDTATANWATLGGAPTTYTDGVFVRFQDSASNGVVTLNQNVVPASINVSNTSLAYTLNGGGGIGGAGDLVKRGSGSLILGNSGFNTFSGDVTISAGTLQIGNNDASGNIPDTADVANNGALVFARSDLITVSNLISGTGTVSQNSAGLVTLSGANTYSGATTVAQGTLITGNNAALGTTAGGTTIASGATLDVGANAINLGQEQITVSGIGVGGAGALVNNSGSPTFVGPNAARVTMVGHTTAGGTGRFDLRANPTANPTLASLSTGGQPYKLTKVGPGTFGLIGITVDPQLGDIEVQQGTFSTEAAMTSLGNAASNLIVYPGATFQMFAVTNLLNKVFTLGGDGSAFTVSATSGANTIIGPMSVTNDCVFSVNAAAVSLNLSNVITGPGKITKVGLGTLILSGNSTDYAGCLQLNAGNTTINGTLSNSLGVNVAVGKLALNGTLLGGGVTNAGFTTLAGSGSSAGVVDVSGGLLPGDTNIVGTFTAGGLILQAGATLAYELASVNTVGGGTNDLVVVNGDLTVNGNSITINPLGLLQTGVPYRLFNYTGSLVWNGDLSVTGPNNYLFTVNTNTAGQVNIVASGGPPVWNGGSATVNNWSDPANWNGVTIAPNDTLYFAGNNRLNNTNNTAADTTYNDVAFNSDAGAFVLNGNSIALAGNVINNSINTQSINLAMSLGGNRSFNGNTGILNVMGNLTNTTAMTLTLGGTGVVANALIPLTGTETNVIATMVTNASWTLVDNLTTTALTNPTALDIQAGTLNFGTATSAPKLISTTAVNTRLGVIANAPATLNMVNGLLTIAVRFNTGGGGNAIATLNQSGGTINVRDVMQVSDSAATAHTAMNVTGGTFNVADEAGALRNFFLASRGTGIVTVANSGVINCATLDMSRNAAGNTLGSVGVVNLNGGTLAVTRVGAATSAAQAGGTPTATFNFNGGTLVARASSATFYQGNASAPAIPITSIVKVGGAIIDTDTNAISILEPLQHDSTLGGTADGGLIKQGAGTLTLTAASTYTGNTVISNGTLLVNGSIGASAVSIENGGQLAGTGSVGDNVSVNVGGTISAGAANATGNLTVAGNVTLLPGATAFLELNKTAAASDQIRAIAGTATTITYAGTLSLTNLAGTLAAGDSFKLFSASNYLGSFSSITPASPGAGLQWVTSALNTSGTISVVAPPVPRITTLGVIGGNIVLSGTNGPAGNPYWVLTSTDVSLPISSWTPVTTNNFDSSGNFSFTNGAPSDPQRFYLLQVP